MNVESSTRHMAIRRIFRKRSKRKAGGSLTGADLQRDWIKTGLRWSDLQIGVRELIQRRVLVLHTGKFGVCLELTARGEHEIDSPVYDLLTRIVDWLKLETLRMRRRNSTPGSGFRRRRLIDRLR